MDLPDRAKAMYKTWWSFVSYAASAVDPTGQFKYLLTDATAAAADIAKTIGGIFAKWDPIGLGQLFSAARRIAGIGQTIESAADETVTSTLNIPEAPWSRSSADQLAAPKWTVRANATYLNELGEEVTGWFPITIDTVLPSTVGDLKAQVSSSIDQSLTAASAEGTPRRGQLVSLGTLTLAIV